MAALISGFKFAQKLKNTRPRSIYILARNLAAWNKDWKPSKYPTTQKDRDEAAKKYYLMPEEYRPYADDGLGHGDYPQLDAGLGAEAKDNFYPYDYPEFKRNFNEPLHADFDIYGEDRYSQPYPPAVSNPVAWLIFLAVMAGFGATYLILENFKTFRPVAVKQYPGDGRIHYTFEEDCD